ncbi:MAG: protein-glutamate O-methyltransferase CheR [Clostridiales bacterium]|nr:protein-glutamate O-methyltransferase CheR [Clostridiales bacterium]
MNKELLEIEDIEIKLLLDAIYLKYGYDFENYTQSHIKRRILRRVRLNNLANISQLTEKIIHDEKVFRQLLKDFSINTTEMFRYPQFYKDIREKIVPILKTYPSVNIWSAGCSTGEEVLSMAILLREEGLMKRVRIYATDFNSEVLEIAKKGIYPVENIRKWTKNYQEAGGKESFSRYYTAKYDYAIFNQELFDNITYLEHNLVTDGKFITAHLIACRNVLIYFNKELQNRVLELFDESLVEGGILGIGDKEELKFSTIGDRYESMAGKSKIYKKKLR